MTKKEKDWVFIGTVSRPFGVLGAVKLNLLNEESVTLHEGLSLRLENAKGESILVTLGKVRPDARVDVNGWTNRDQALIWGKAKVFVLRSDLPPLSEEELYLVDLLGASVIDTNDDPIGSIVGFSDNGAQPLAEVLMKNGKRALVPFLPPIVQEIDLENKVVVLDPPEGLLE